MRGAGRRGSLASRNRRVAREALGNSRAAGPKRVSAKAAQALALVDAPPGAWGEGWAGAWLPDAVERTPCRSPFAVAE